MDVFKNLQRFFEGHSNDVVCLGWNSARRLCISGQVDEKVGKLKRRWPRIAERGTTDTYQLYNVFHNMIYMIYYCINSLYNRDLNITLVS